MTPMTPTADLFKLQIGESLRQETLNSHTFTIHKNDNVYTCGDNDNSVYFIQSGQVKLQMVTPEGKYPIAARHSSAVGAQAPPGFGPRRGFTGSAMTFSSAALFWR